MGYVAEWSVQGSVMEVGLSLSDRNRLRAAGPGRRATTGGDYRSQRSDRHG